MGLLRVEGMVPESVEPMTVDGMLPDWVPSLADELIADALLETELMFVEVLPDELAVVPELPWLDPPPGEPDDPEPPPDCIGVVDDDEGCAGRPAPTLTMMSPNCSGSLSRPSVSIGIWVSCPSRAGGSPIWPAGASRFWLRMALATSMAVMPREASFCGSSQARTL